MNGAFGGPVRLLPEQGEDGLSGLAAHENMDLVRRNLLSLATGGLGFLRIYRPKATAAFSPRDTTMERYPEAADAMRGLGFEPVERRAGGQLAVYDESALVIDLVAHHADPRIDVMERYRQFSGALASAFRSLGVDARIGALDGEYCPGDYSVNGEGRLKLAGVAQRIVKAGFHLGAVISVAPSKPARTAVSLAYDILDMPFDPRTFGAIADFDAALSFATVRERLLWELTGLLAMEAETGP